MSRFVFCGICDTNLGVFFERDAEDDAPGLDSCRTTIVGTSRVSNSWRISRRFTRESRRFPCRSSGLRPEPDTCRLASGRPPAKDQGPRRSAAPRPTHHATR
jgi:hypothetical protein